MDITFKGYNETTASMVYEFSNPFGGEPMTKYIKPTLNEDGTLDKEAMELRLEAHTRTVTKRMKAAQTKTPTAKGLGVEAYVEKTATETPEPVVEEPVTETKPKTEDKAVVEDAVVVEETPAPKKTTRKRTTRKPTTKK